MVVMFLILSLVVGGLHLRGLGDRKGGGRRTTQKFGTTCQHTPHDLLLLLTVLMQTCGPLHKSAHTKSRVAIVDYAHVGSATTSFKALVAAAPETLTADI